MYLDGGGFLEALEALFVDPHQELALEEGREGGRDGGREGRHESTQIYTGGGREGGREGGRTWMGEGFSNPFS